LTTEERKGKERTMVSSPRSSRVYIAFTAASLLLASGAFAISACSSTTAVGGDTTPDGSADATPDRKVGADAAEVDSGTPLTPAQCQAQCQADHPNAVAKENAIDTCWTANCQAPCIDQSGGFDAGPDAAVDGGADAGGDVCGTQVSSGVDLTCDQCTNAFCCTSWQGCFNDPDCTAYDKCLGDCNP
jgi:hypothetical protein